jgi:hypothetical protein
MMDLQPKAALISFGTLGRWLRYAQVEVDVCTFSSNFSEQFPLVGARLEVRHGFSTVAFERRLVVSPDFFGTKKEEEKTREKRFESVLWRMEKKRKNFFLSCINGRIQAQEPCSLYFVVE